jgi:energy-coupling factor transporter ATP-binding protein EcfA2
MLLLLDEPTSPLDPQSIEEFMQILKELVAQNTTIVLVTHKPEDLQFMDEVVFLAEGGYLAFKGDISSYLDHFKVDTTVEVYSELSGENAMKWKDLNLNTPLSHVTIDQSSFSVQKVKWFKQLFWLTTRSIKIKTNDKLNTAILILQAPIIAFLIGLIFNEIALSVLFMIIISSIWFGVNNASREIVKEKNIFERERLFNVRVGSYLLSKALTLFLLAVVQTGLFVFILQVNYSNDEIQLGNSIAVFGWLLLVTVVASFLGLLVSASMKTTDKVMALVPILLIPQIMLAGVITKITSPIVESISYLTFARWGTEGLGHIQEKVIIDSKEIVVDSLGMPMKDANGDVLLTDIVKNSDASILLEDQYHSAYNTIFGSLAGQFVLDFVMIVIIGLALYFSVFMVLNRKSK